METGCIHIYTGDGKGKTTAAIGLATRAAGQNLRVGFCQFLKSGTSGELASLEKLGVKVVSPETDGKFLWELDESEKATRKKQQQEILKQAAKMAPLLDLLILDEAVCAASAEMLEQGALEAFMQNKPASLELVLTGRGAAEELMAKADYVTEMRLVAHPFQKGKKARRGIEY